MPWVWASSNCRDGGLRPCFGFVMIRPLGAELALILAGGPAQIGELAREFNAFIFLSFGAMSMTDDNLFCLGHYKLSIKLDVRIY